MANYIEYCKIQHRKALCWYYVSYFLYNCEHSMPSVWSEAWTFWHETKKNAFSVCFSPWKVSEMIFLGRMAGHTQRDMKRNTDMKAEFTFKILGSIFKISEQNR